MKIALASYSGTTPFFDLLIPDRGLAALAAVLEQQGVEYRLYDLNRLDRSPGDFLWDLREFRPDVVGFKFFDTGFVGCELLAKQVRLELPNATLVAGGPHVTLFQEHIFCATRAFDVLIYGEGESAIVELLTAIADGRGLDDVPGAIFRRSGGVAKNAQALIHDLDVLPLPRWEALDLDAYLPIAMLNAYRGCPFTCSFCAHNRTWGYEATERGYRPVVRKHSIAAIRAEIDHAISLGMPLFGFADSTPLPDLWRDIAREFISTGEPVSWTSFAYVGHFEQADFNLLADSGCAALWYGIESGSPELRNVMGKRFSNAEALETFGWATDAGIEAIPGFIIGFPGETAKTVQQTTDLRRDLGSRVSVLSPFILDPGTPVSLDPSAFGVSLEPHWEDHIVKRLGLTEWDVPYFRVNGISNVDHWRHFSRMYDYPGYEHDRNIAESEFAYLLARGTDRSPEWLVYELDSSLKTFDERRLRKTLEEIRQAL